ncbi:hypothetical protein CIB48_g4557 [Xylaria polymorpha]|nr:hypothetical protein CIB48_g4557 [Xylaria polymorpha]
MNCASPPDPYLYPMAGLRPARHFIYSSPGIRAVGYRGSPHSLGCCSVLAGAASVYEQERAIGGLTRMLTAVQRSLLPLFMLYGRIDYNYFTTTMVYDEAIPIPVHLVGVVRGLAMCLGGIVGFGGHKSTRFALYAIKSHQILFEGYDELQSSVTGRELSMSIDCSELWKRFFIDGILHLKLNISRRTSNP